MPELPSAKQKRFEEEYKLTNYDAEILTRDKDLSQYFKEAVDQAKLVTKEGEIKPTPKDIANYIINKKVDIEKITVQQLIHSIQSSLIVSDVSDDKLNETVDKVISENEKAVSDYKSGKETVIMFLVGQVMRQFPEKIDAGKVKAVLTAKLK